MFMLIVLGHCLARFVAYCDEEVVERVGDVLGVRTGLVLVIDERRGCSGSGFGRYDRFENSGLRSMVVFGCSQLFG